MSKENNGGYAFPSQSPIRATEMGATLRDYFAAKAMQGYLSNSTFMENLIKHCKKEGIDPDFNLSHYSYSLADAMIEERLNDSKSAQW